MANKSRPSAIIQSVPRGTQERMKKMSKIIKVTHMGVTKEWVERNQAIAYYGKLAVSSSGIVQYNAIKVLNQLNSGQYICSDETP